MVVAAADTIKMKFGFIFPGQGSQSFGMGLEIYNNSTKAKELLQNASDMLKIDFANLLFKENDLLGLSEFTQPAIVLNSFMSYLALIERTQICSSVNFGHSLGEFSALGVSGAMDFLDAIKIVNLRGKFMQNDCDKIKASMMVVLGLSDEKVTQICQEAQTQNYKIWAANFNCDGQVVVAGIRDDLELFANKFKEAGAKRAMLLNMSVASHCPLLEEASNLLANELDLVLKDSFEGVISNVTAEIYTDKTSALNLLKKQLTSPVLYKKSVEFADNFVDSYVEFGASVLSGINKKITQKPTYSLHNLASLDEICKIMES